MLMLIIIRKINQIVVISVCEFIYPLFYSPYNSDTWVRNISLSYKCRNGRFRLHNITEKIIKERIGVSNDIVHKSEKKIKYRMTL